MTAPPRARAVRVYIVCGGQRTGTTLLAAILSSDGRTNPLGQEAQLLTRIIEAYRWGRENFEHFGSSFFDDQVTYLAFFRTIAARFAQDVSARISPGGVLILKNPELSRVLHDVAELLPNAKLLAIVRDPRDQVASMLQVQAQQSAAARRNPTCRRRNMSDSDKRYASHYPVSYKLEMWARQLAPRFRRHVLRRRNIFDLANRYASYYPEILDLHAQRPERIRVVRYEDLVLRPEEALLDLRVATGLELEFDPGRPWPRVSSLADLNGGPTTSDLYGGPIDSRSVGRFRHDLTVKEVACVDSVCADIMSAFGYVRGH